MGYTVLKVLNKIQNGSCVIELKFIQDGYNVVYVCPICNNLVYSYLLVSLRHPNGFNHPFESKSKCKCGNESFIYGNKYSNNDIII